MLRKPMCKVAGIRQLQRQVSDLLNYLERNQSALVHCAALLRQGEPISTAFVESTVKRDCGQANEQEAAVPVEPDDDAGLPRC
jgi:hypothetical protein